MKIFGTCINGYVAIVRDDPPALFLTFSKGTPNGSLDQERLMECARVAQPISEYRKTLSADMGRAINATLANLRNA